MLLLLVLIAIGVLTVTLQNYFCKNLFKTRSDNFAYSAVVYVFAVITTFLVNGCRIGELSLFSAIDGVFYGLMMTVELYFTLQAYKTGSMSFTSLFVVAAIMIPIIPSWLFWGEPVTWQQITGIAVMFVAIAMILNVTAADRKTINVKWLKNVIPAFLASGLAGVCEMVLTQSEYADQSDGFILFGLVFAVVTMLLVLLFLTKKEKEPVTFKPTLRISLPTVCIGIFYSLACIITLAVLKQLPASVVFTLNNGVRLIIVTVLDVLLFREQINKKQYAGLALGIVGIILLSV